MKKKGIIEQALYGNDKADFSVNDYPVNRFHAFFTLLKTNWLTWIYISLITTASFLPIYFIYTAKNAYIISQTISMEPNLVNSFTITVNLIYSFISIPLWMIGFIILNGSIGLIRKMTFKEGFLFWSDFKAALKSGFKNSIINSLIFSICMNLCSFNMSFILLDKELPKILVYSVFLVSIIIMVIIMEITLLNCNLNAIYNLSVKNMYKNSFLLLFGKPLKNLLFTFIFIWPILLIIFVPNFIISIIILFFILVFFMAMNIQILFLYSCHLFDIYINKENAKEIYRKGLRRL